ncbi:hypothetical protein BKD30_07455 [Tersicoccus phoenicis]|uniref:Uncharacterized protein n=1 Tax=Tersicoccus phoenicis TaxID=554083 RepID=A0A1R1LBA1_9MICC|nr:hypothetical protein [Tersicoccus phoenicis]OMH24830.1 hypothetical protein BKD30_07455 [Tersicoccus phoenicis]
MANDLLTRSLHDLGAAAWFGGSLMGAVGVNGAAAAAKEPAERARLSTIGWAKWSPVQLGAMLAHGVGGVGLILGNKSRLAGQKGATANTVVKAGLTLAGAGMSVYSGVLGKRMGALTARGAATGAAVEGPTEPGPAAPAELKSTQKQLKLLQWALPVVVGAVIVLGAQQGEQQRPTNVSRGLLRRH